MWIESYRDAFDIWGAEGEYLYMPYPNVYVRYSTAHASLCAVLVDVLIVVGAETEGWCWKGHRRALDRMQASIVKRVINGFLPFGV